MNAISVLILTLNEESNLAECIDSCAWSDDIVVFDSLSQDRPRKSRATRARVFERRFDNYAAQRNAALTTVSYLHEWVLMVDADERIPQDLVAEMQTAVAAAGDEVALFRMRRKDFFSRQVLRRSSGYPAGSGVWSGSAGSAWSARSTRNTSPWGGRTSSDTCITIPSTADRYWFERHNRYSTAEAVAKLSLHRGRIDLAALFRGDPIDRRRTLKQLLYYVPLRPQIVFFYLYIIRLGILDGRGGLYSAACAQATKC